MLAILAPIFASLAGALPSFAPLLVQVGLYFVNMFVKNQAQKDANAKAFMDAISAHLNDSLLSVQERQNAWAQRQELMAKAKARDEAAAKGSKDGSH